MVLGGLGGLSGSLVASWWALGAILAHLGPKSQHNIQKVGLRTPLGPHLGAILAPKLTNLAQSELTRCLLEVKLAQVGPKLAQVGSKTAQEGPRCGHAGGLRTPKSAQGPSKRCLGPSQGVQGGTKEAPRRRQGGTG